METIKRVFAMVLALCLLLPVIPTAGVSAATQTGEVITYSFELKDSGLQTTDGKNMGGKGLTASTVRNALDAYYADGTIGWKFALDNISAFASDTVTASNTYNIGQGSAGSWKWDGLRLGMKLGSLYPGNYWTAFTIRSPGANTYKITLDYQTRHDGAQNANVYLIKGTFDGVAEVEAKMTEENLIKTVNFRGGSNFADASSVLDVVTMEDCEYTLVFKAPDVPSGAYMHINALTFEKTQPKVELPPVQVKELEYNFNLQATDLKATDGSSLAGATLDATKVKEALETYYEEQQNYWKYAADNLQSFKQEGNTVASTFVFGKGTEYKWTGLRMGVKVTGPDVDAAGKKISRYPEGWWLATNIHAPGTGVYYLTLDYQMRSDATQGGEIYLIKGALTDPAEIEKQMTPANLLITLNCKSKRTDMVDKQADLGAVSFEKGEYTLVFKGAKNSGNASAHMYINKLTAVHESIAPPPAAPETVYNFDLANRNEGIYSGAPTLSDKIDDIAQRYAAGELNWKYQDKAANLGLGSHAFNAIYGMVMYTSVDNWMAFKIKSPGEGLHTLILNHARSGNGALGAVYILDADTEDIQSAMDHSNRVSKIEFYNESGDPNVSSGYTTILDTYNFEADKEYIIVFEAYTSTIYKKDLGYMWLSQLIAREGDHTVTGERQRKVNSIVVSADSCKTMETTAYMTTAEINGQDFLFMPTEGKKMFIFNLEDMTRERVVRTPFGIARGITVDEEGIIWIVGDSSVLFRYDPVTNTGFTTRNYKTSNGVNSTSGFTVTCHEGMVYFGAGWTANIGKYDPRTDRFSTVAGTINTDASYACAVIIRDGYLYAGFSGDRNADGQATAEIVKIDLATETVADRVDILEQFGEDEVMVRGMGICGNMLFAGGNSMDGFVAVNTDTMELKDYGIHRAINLGVTEEIDGKIYLVVSGIGIHCYDSATDKVTKINNMDTATIGFRCGEHSSVTLSNNPLFPGISYVTQGGTGIKIYNVETKQVFTPHLYDEEVDGSGQLIRTVVSGEAGDSKLYIGGYNTVNCAIFDTKDGAVTTFEATSAQTDSILWYNGRMYVGNYNAGNVVQINFDDPDRNVILQSMKSLYHQARVHALAAGDGMIFAGTIPDWNLFGGALAIIPIDNLDERHVEENLIDTQSITSLAYGQGILYGGTSIAGGTSATRQPDDKTSAVIFAYDVANKKLLGQLDLREVFPELPDILPYIDGIVADPNVEENGRFWGMISETLFTFTFDKATGKFTVKEQLSFGKTKMPDNIGRHWDACNFDFDDEGNIYAVFHTVGGVQKINMEDPTQHERINCEIPRTFTLGPDGNLYYSLNHAELKMYPLDVTEEDWQAAEAVDDLILAIDKTVTLQSEAGIVAARKAYDALSLKHRALIQEYSLLLMSETDLLEAKIETIGTVTLQSESLIKGMMAAYEAMPVKEQGYVKNYDKLNAAYIALQGLVNQREASRVQTLLNNTLASLGEITLEDEAAIKELRQAYDSLIFLQRELVDASGLLAAEAKIQVLRQEKVTYLQQLIASIGEVTLEDEAAITEAMEIWNWLDMYEREKIDMATLSAANKRLTQLQKEAAAAVDALINQIGDTITHDSKDAIAAARQAYDALTEGAKKYVKNLTILTEAETIYAELGLNPTVIIVLVVTAVVVLAATAAVVLLMMKKKKATASAEETSVDPE